MRASETAPEVLFEISRDLLGSASQDGYFTSLNPAWEAALGYPLDVLMARPFIDFVHPDDRNSTLAELEGIFEGREAIDFENRYSMAGGGWRYLSWQARAHGDRVYFIARDITEEIVSTHRSHLMTDLIEGIDDAIFTMTPEGIITSWNTNCEEIYGYATDEAVGQSINGLIVPGDEHYEPELIVRRLQKGHGIRQFTTRRKCKDGSMVSVSQTASLMRDRDSQVIGTVVVSRDVSAIVSNEAEVPGELNIITWVTRVRDAIDDDRIHFHAQPIINLDNGSVSYELLCRMTGPDGDSLSPQYFLQAAERFGLIEELDLMGLKEAARSIAKGYEISVNISTATARRRHIVDVIAELLEKADADPSMLTVEITETALMRSLSSGERFARGLADLGVRIALDDFGTGFGGFTYLKKLRIQRLKIDVEFVCDLYSSPASQHVVKAVVALAEGFNLDTVAEGVEDAHSAVLLRELGVSHAQGYHYARPGPIDEILGKPVVGASRG